MIVLSTCKRKRKDTAFAQRLLMLQCPENSYYQGNKLKGQVIPEQQEGGYMTVIPGIPTYDIAEDGGDGYLDL